MVIGALTEGRFQPSSASFVDIYVHPWLTPFSIAVGLFALVLFAYLAAVYLTLASSNVDVVEVFRTRALVSGLLTALLALHLATAAISVSGVRAN